MSFTPSIKVKVLREGAQLPLPQKRGDACVDLIFWPADGESIFLARGDTAVLETGLAMEIPEGWEGLIRPRSGLAAKEDVFVLNTPGTIDSGYRGEIKVILHRVARFGLGNSNLCLQPGARIAQMCFKPVYEPLMQQVDELSPSERGTGGLGSTGV